MPVAESLAQGNSVSPFDWKWFKIEQALHGIVELMGERNGDPRVWTINMGLWEGEVRPQMPEGMIQVYTQGQELIEAKKIEPGLQAGGGSMT